MDTLKLHEAHERMAALQRTADEIRLARTVRRAQAAAAGRPTPAGPAISQAKAKEPDRGAACPDELAQTRPA